MLIASSSTADHRQDPRRRCHQLCRDCRGAQQPPRGRQWACRQACGTSSFGCATEWKAVRRCEQCFLMKLHSSLILFMVLCWAKGAAAGLPSDIFGLGPLQWGLSSYCMAATGLSRTIASGQRLADWGYAALLIDSFGPRGFQEVCNRGLLVPPICAPRPGACSAGWGDRLAWRVGGAEGSDCRARPPAERTGFRRRRRLLPRL